MLQRKAEFRPEDKMVFFVLTISRQSPIREDLSGAFENLSTEWSWEEDQVPVKAPLNFQMNSVINF